MQLEKLKQRLEIVTSRIQKLEGTKYYTDSVANSFYLGMVGGSGKNTARLNRRRENEINKTVQNAVLCVALYKERNKLQIDIADLENNGPAKRAEIRTAKNALMAQYWQNLKVGDTVYLWTGNEATITKKNKKSIETGTGCKWTAAEIIGKEAANIII